MSTTYKFDSAGGFWAIDDIFKVAEYAYPTSLNGTEATKSAKDAMHTANRMIKTLIACTACISAAQKQYERAMNAK